MNRAVVRSPGGLSISSLLNSSAVGDAVVCFPLFDHLGMLALFALLHKGFCTCAIGERHVGECAFANNIDVELGA